MPIVVTCPKCPTKLSAPDSAAGKKVRCPKCGTAAPVPAHEPELIPAEEVPVIEATVAPPKPKPKPVVADAGDDDDRPRKKSRREEEDADDAPPRKKKKRRYDDDPPRRKRRNAGGGSGGIIAVIVIGAILLIGVVGGAIYFLTGKGSPLAKRTPVPAGWVQHSDDGIKAYFPKMPAQTTVPANGLGMGGRFGAGGFQGGWGGGGFGAGNDYRDAEAVSTYSSGDWTDSVHVEVVVIRFKSKVPSAMRDELRNFKSAQWGGMETRTLKWLGSDAVEMVMQGSVIRVACTDRLIVMATITGKGGARAAPDEEAGFFDNFEALK